VASRDLKSLVEQGLLVPKGERRGRYYVASDGLREILVKTREGRRVEDPFDQKPGDFLPPGRDRFVR
jgi:hypothetical protein